MNSFEEGYQKFDFDDSWHVVKYDKHPDYLDKIQKLQETKAVDFIGLRGGILFWIEVKDFRGNRIPQKQNHPTAMLAVEIAQKVRDSIAGVIGAHYCSSDENTWRPFVEAIWQKRTMKVLFLLEEDLPVRPRGRNENQSQVRAEAIKKNLRWLTTKVFVASKKTGGCPDGLTVTDLPGAGQNSN